MNGKGKQQLPEQVETHLEQASLQQEAGLKADYPQHDKITSPAIPKPLTHQCSPAHCSAKVSSCQHSLDKISFHHISHTTQTVTISSTCTETQQVLQGLPSPLLKEGYPQKHFQNHGHFRFSSSCTQGFLHTFYSVTILTIKEASLHCPCNSSSFHLGCC